MQNMISAHSSARIVVRWKSSGLGSNRTAAGYCRTSRWAGVCSCEVGGESDRASFSSARRSSSWGEVRNCPSNNPTNSRKRRDALFRARMRSGFFQGISSPLRRPSVRAAALGSPNQERARGVPRSGNKCDGAGIVIATAPAGTMPTLYPTVTASAPTPRSGAP
jgi:hypothetical protein